MFSAAKRRQQIAAGVSQQTVSLKKDPSREAATAIASRLAVAASRLKAIE
jgi:hypothetical protein